MRPLKIMYGTFTYNKVHPTLTSTGSTVHQLTSIGSTVYPLTPIIRWKYGASTDSHWKYGASTDILASTVHPLAVRWYIHRRPFTVQ